MKIHGYSTDGVKYFKYVCFGLTCCVWSD